VKVVAATRSAHKLAEIRRILGSVPGLVLVDPSHAGIPPSLEEEGIEAFDTFEENALAKARWFQARSGLPALADDSGLVVDALGGAPGVRSRRFAPGEFPDPDTQDRANNEHLLGLLGDRPLPERTARYVCVAALVVPGREPVLRRGEAEGLILGLPRGRGGFGYDPLFYDRDLGATFAEIPPEAKNARSHRGAAFRAIATALSAGG
jgi:XTP/dITP diphosphohydrolase